MSDENKWSKYKLKIYQGRKGPEPLGSVKFKEIEQKAKEAMKGHLGSYYYGYGSAGVSITEKNNLRAFEKYAIIPRMLVDANTRSFEVTLFGVKYPSPILMSPIGAQAICHPEAEVASARAARNVGIPYIMSTASSRSLEEVAEANGDGFRWYQLYWPRSDEITLSLLRRAEASGYSALVVTVDTQSVGWRPYDLDTAYLPFMHGIGSQVGTSDPVFMARYGLKPALDDRPEFPHDTAKENKLLDDGDEKATQKSRLSMDWVMETIQGKFRPWEDLKILRDNWKGPLLIKGIQCAKDAEKALEYGVDGIVVSNHGGRQVDGAIPSLYALVDIMKSAKVKEAQQSGKLTILLDSGIRTGSDIIKAMALGAQAVFIGRPWLYGLMIGGQAGVEQVLEQTMADLDVSLGLSGYVNLADIQGKGDEVVVKLDF